MSALVQYVTPDDYEVIDDPLVGLSDRERAFVLAYVGGARFNATQAAEDAGYRGSRASLRVLGHGCKARPRVRAAIDALLAGESSTAEESLARVTRRARTTFADVFTIGADGKPVFDMQAAYESGALDAVKKLTVTQSPNGTRRFVIELYDANAADALLLRANGRLKDGGAEAVGDADAQGVIELPHNGKNEASGVES